MLSKLSTLIGSVFCIAAMIAAILRVGPFWVQLAGAAGISALLVAGSLINSTARDAIGRIDSFLKDVEEEKDGPVPTGIARLIHEEEYDECDEGDISDDDSEYRH
jgi:hypothetical protein